LKAVCSVIEKLRSVLPELISQKDKELVCRLRAARHARRYPAMDMKRGRPGEWKREDLLGVAAYLRDILERETSSHTSFASFVDHCLRLPDFPSDVIEVFESRVINLFEAEQLARVTAVRLGVSLGQAKRTRTGLLYSQRFTKASRERLSQRVNELYVLHRFKQERPAHSWDSELDNLEDFDPYPSTYLFSEQIKPLCFAFREIRREDVKDEEIE
jgi:hypothetical protein